MTELRCEQQGAEDAGDLAAAGVDLHPLLPGF